MKYLLDTCVISELIAKQPDTGVIRLVDSLDSDDIYLSVITIGEIARGVERLPASKRKRELADWLQNDLLVRFDGNIIPLDTNILIRWGELSAKLEGIGITLPAMDSLIAATTLTHAMVLITRNAGDFEHTGVEIVNPWGREG